MDARSGDSFIGPFVPESAPFIPEATPTAAAPPSPMLSTSPRAGSKSKNLRIAFQSADVPNTAGSVSRVDLNYLARRLHVPVDTLSRSLADTAGIASSLTDAKSRPVPASTQPSSGSDSRTPNVNIAGGSLAGPAVANSLSGSVREWFGGAGSVSKSFTIRAQRAPSQNSTPAALGPLGTPGAQPGFDPYATRRPSVRLRFVPNPHQRNLIVDLRGRAELGVTWQGWEGGKILVKSVIPGSAAEQAGVIDGMRLVCIDSVPIVSEHDLHANLAAAKCNPTLTLTVQLPVQPTQQVPQSPFTDGLPPAEERHVPRMSRLGPRTGLAMAPRSNRSASNASWDDGIFCESPLGGYEDNNNSAEFDDETMPFVRAASSPHNNGSVDAPPAEEVEIDVHENGATQVVRGQRDSAYLVTDPTQSRSGMVFAVPRRDGDEGALTPSGGSHRGASFLGSLRRGISGVLGFSAAAASASPTWRGTPQEAVAPVQPEPRRVAFADDVGNDLVTSIRQYDEIDTVVIEFQFHFPPWVWATLVLAFLSSLITPALMLSASSDKHKVPMHLVIACQCLFELGMTLIMALAFLPLLLKESYEYLRGWGWLSVVVAGLCYALFRNGTVLLVDQAGNCDLSESDPNPERCPPIFFECLAPLLLICYYCGAAYFEKRGSGVSETPVFPLELIGLLLVVGGAAVMLVKQHEGMNVRATVFGLLASFGMAVDLLMKRDISSQLPVPLSLFLMQVVGTVGTLVCIAIFSPLDSSEFHYVADNKTPLILSGVSGFFTALFSVLVLRHLHPYPMSATLTCSHLTFIAAVHSMFDISIDTTNTLAIPAVFVTVLGGCLAIWSNLHHRSVVEVEIVQEKRLHRRKATGIKGPHRRKSPKNSQENMGYSIGSGSNAYMQQ